MIVSHLIRKRTVVCIVLQNKYLPIYSIHLQKKDGSEGSRPRRGGGAGGGGGLLPPPPGGSRLPPPPSPQHAPSPSAAAPAAANSEWGDFNSAR